MSRPVDGRPLKRRILIVDDVPAMRHFLRLMIGGLLRGTAIDEAADGIQALRLATENPYDLILLDLNLPLLDGMKVLAALRTPGRATVGTPVMVVSSAHDAETLRRARELGVTHVLPKPVRAPTLLDAACEAMGLPIRPQLSGERRQVRRISIPIRLRLGSTDVIDATTWDMSEAGAFVVSDRLFPIGACILAELFAPHLDHPLHVDCEVVHMRPALVGTYPAGFGVRFCNVTLELAHALVDILTSSET
jgi:two-component system chemotaxis response regulator CheY